MKTQRLYLMFYTSEKCGEQVWQRDGEWWGDEESAKAQADDLRKISGPGTRTEIVPIDVPVRLRRADEPSAADPLRGRGSSRPSASSSSTRSRTAIPPRFTEIGEAAGIASLNGVNDHLKLIERRGLIRRARGQARGIVVTDAGVAALGEAA